MGGIAWVRQSAFGFIAVAGSLLTSGARAEGGYMDWSGLYAGAQLGWATSDIHWQYVNANFFNTNGSTVFGNGFDHDPQGLIGGFLGGYNFQEGPWILGIEVAASAADMHQDRASPFFPASDTYSSQVNWLTTITGRIGYAWYRWMLYAKGGWAGGETRVTLDNEVADVYAAENQWANGWTIGGGVDYRLCEHVSLGAAYDYANLNIDNKTITCPTCGSGPGFGTPSVDGDIKVQSVMARLTFRQ